MNEQSTYQNPKIQSPLRKNYCRAHKAVFVVYDMVLKKFGSELGPQISKPYIYELVAEQTFKEPPTAGMIINSMLKDGYVIDPDDPDIIRIMNVLKGRAGLGNKI